MQGRRSMSILERGERKLKDFKEISCIVCGGRVGEEYCFPILSWNTLFSFSPTLSLLQGILFSFILLWPPPTLLSKLNTSRKRQLGDKFDEIFRLIQHWKYLSSLQLTLSKGSGKLTKLRRCVSQVSFGGKGLGDKSQGQTWYLSQSHAPHAVQF